MAPVNRCVRCDYLIDDSNDSEEHIIQNSVGGRLTVKGFICRACNNRTGETWDAVFAEQLNFFCQFFGIVRDRGTPPPQPIVTTAGEHLLMQPGGGFKMKKPIYREALTGDGKRQIQITARDRREASIILKGLARKYPNQIDIDAELARVAESYTYPKGIVQHSPQFGGELGGRSVVKSAIAFAFYSGVPVEHCDLAMKYLRNENAEPSFGYYYERDLVAGRPAGIPIHCVAVVGDPITGMLLGYVEYFGVHRVVVCFSQSYAGPPLAQSYGLDPTTGEAVSLRVDLPFTSADIQSIYDYERIPDGGMQLAFAEVAPSALKRHFDQELARVSERAARYGMENCGAKPGDVLTPKQALKAAELATEKMMPFILRHARRQ